MGTPEFAVEGLKSLVEKNYNVVGVITATDKPAGRGKKIKYSAVKEYALENNLRLLQPQSLKNEDFIKELKSLNADLQIVVAFRMLPEIVWNMPPKGTFNLHASLLPQYRGAAPINHAIINGESKTGLTTFFLDKEIDTGRIIEQMELEISLNDNAGTLHDKMMVAGADLILKTVNGILEDNLVTVEQSALVTQGKALNPAPKIFKDDCAINWNKKANVINNFIRGLSPYPSSHTRLISDGKSPIYLKVFSCKVELCEHAFKNGIVVSENGELKISVSDGFVHLLEIQQSGKRRMLVEDFLRGVNIQNDYFAELF